MMRRHATWTKDDVRPFVIRTYDGASVDMRRVASTDKALAAFSNSLADKRRIERIIGEARERGQVVGRAERDFLYIVARSLTSTRNDLGQRPIPNGNFDCFIHSELTRTNDRFRCPSFQTFVGRGLFTNHESDRVERCFGTQLDVRFAYGDPPIGKADTSIHNLLAIDKEKAEGLGILSGLRNGSLKTWSMGCDIDAAVCSICGNMIQTDSDQKCEHVSQGMGRGKEMVSGASQFPWNGQKVRACDILIGPCFVELSAVTVPADHTAETMDVIGEVDDVARRAASSMMEIPPFKTFNPSRETNRAAFMSPGEHGEWRVTISEEHVVTFGDMQAAKDYLIGLKNDGFRTAAYDDPGKQEYGTEYASDEEDVDEIAHVGDSTSPRTPGIFGHLIERDFDVTGPLRKAMAWTRGGR